MPEEWIGDIFEIIEKDFGVISKDVLIDWPAGFIKGWGSLTAEGYGG